MPFSTPGAGDTLGLAIMAAQNAVASAFAAAHTDGGEPSESEKAQLRVDMAKAMGNAINAHILAFGVGSLAVVGVTAGAGAATGSLT